MLAPGQVITWIGYTRLWVPGYTCYREVVCSPGHFLKGAVNLSLENQINWYYA